MSSFVNSLYNSGTLFDKPIKICTMVTSMSPLRESMGRSGYGDDVLPGGPVSDTLGAETDIPDNEAKQVDRRTFARIAAATSAVLGIHSLPSFVNAEGKESEFQYSEEEKKKIAEAQKAIEEIESEINREMRESKNGLPLARRLYKQKQAFEKLEPTKVTRDQRRTLKSEADNIEEVMKGILAGVTPGEEFTGKENRILKTYKSRIRRWMLSHANARGARSGRAVRMQPDEKIEVEMEEGVNTREVNGFPVTSRVVTGEGVGRLEKQRILKGLETSFPSIDNAVTEHMKLVGSTAASFCTITQLENGKVVMISCAYGHKDLAKKEKMQIDIPMRIASGSKVFTRFVIAELIASGIGNIKESTRVCDYLGLRPRDPLMSDITIKHLIEHEGGFDRKMVGDVVFAEEKIVERLQVSGPMKPEHIARYVATEPLQFTPGARRSYSNVGYVLLGLIAEKAFNRGRGDKKSFEEIVQELCAKKGVGGVKLSPSDPAKRTDEPEYRSERGIVGKSTKTEAVIAAGGLTVPMNEAAKLLWLHRDDARYRSQAGSRTGTSAQFHVLNGRQVYAVAMNARRRGEVRHEDKETLKNNMDNAVANIPSTVR